MDSRPLRWYMRRFPRLWLACRVLAGQPVAYRITIKNGALVATDTAVVESAFIGTQASWTDGRASARWVSTRTD